MFNICLTLKYQRKLVVKMNNAYTYTHRKCHYKIVKPVRFFFFVLIVTMAVVFAGYSILGSGHTAEAAAETVYTKVIVQENDTLWDIVETYNPDCSKDIRDAVCEICSYNNIKASDIQPGDIIYVPVY